MGIFNLRARLRWWRGGGGGGFIIREGDLIEGGGNLRIIAELSRSSILVEPCPSVFIVMANGMFRGRVRRRAGVSSQVSMTSRNFSILEPKRGFVYRALPAATQPMSR